jgi:hypothetical protein
VWGWYINATITIVDIIDRPVFYLKQGVSEIGFCLRLRAEPTQFGAISFCQVPPEDGDGMQTPKLHVLNKGKGNGWCPEL